MEANRVIILMTLILLLTLPCVVRSAKILVLTLSQGSHLMTFLKISEALIKRGHEVHALMNGKCKGSQELVDIGVTLHAVIPPSGCIYEEDKEILQKQMDSIVKSDFFGIVEALKTNAFYAMEEADTLFHDEKLFEELRNLDFDLCMINGIFPVYYFYIVPYKLDIPYVSLVTAMTPLDAGIPSLPSFTPVKMAVAYSDEMNYFQRIMNTFLTISLETVLNFHNPVSKENIAERFAPEKPFKSIQELRRGSSLWLITKDDVLDYPEVQLPHVIDVGGLNTKPAKSLPDDLQAIADEAVNGLIVVSFGTYVTSISEPLCVKLFNELKQVKQTIIMRHDGPNFTDIVPNIHLRTWIPQNDLLGHPNTKIFITHCGMNGQYEALYHGIPMIGLPIFGDQFYNSLKMAKKGMGIGLGLMTYKEGEVVAAIQEIMENGTYSKMMSKYSAIFKDKPMSPMETLVHSVEHLHKYGTKHLVSPAIHYPWYIYWCIDILIFYVTVTALIIYVLYHLLKMFCNTVRRNCCKQKKQ